MSLLTYDWHPPDPTGAVNAYLSGLRIGVAQQEHAQRLAADALEQARLRKRFEEQHALQLQQESRLAGAEQLRQGYHAAAEARKASDILTTRKAADDIIASLTPSLPSGGVPQNAPQTTAQSLIGSSPEGESLAGGYWNAPSAPTARPETYFRDGAAESLANDFWNDHGKSQPAPPDPTSSFMPSVAGQDQFDIDPVTGDPRMVSAGVGTTGAKMKAIPRDAAGRILPSAAREVTGGLPAGDGASSENPLLDVLDGHSLQPKPTRATVPDIASQLRALPPKDVIALQRGNIAAQLRDASKPVATPRPDPLRTMPDGSLARVGADNKPVIIATKPPSVVTPQQQENMLNTERDNATGDVTRYQKQLGTITKGLKPVDLGYAWEPVKDSGKWYRMGDPHPISAQQASAQNAVAQQVADLKAKIEAAEKKAQAIDARGAARTGAAPATGATDKYAIGTTAKKDGKTYIKTASGWVEQ